MRVHCNSFTSRMVCQAPKTINKEERPNEHTFVLIKPDAVSAGLTDTILERLQNKGLEVVRVKILQLTTDDILRWRSGWSSYDDVFWMHARFMASGLVVACELCGDNAVEKAITEKGEIRSEYATSKLQNAMHCPDSPEEAQNEIAVFFSLENGEEFNG